MLTVLSLPFSAGQYSGSAGHSALAPSLLSPPCLNRFAFNRIHKGSLLSTTSKQSISLCFFFSSFQISIIFKFSSKSFVKRRMDGVNCHLCSFPATDRCSRFESLKKINCLEFNWEAVQSCFECVLGAQSIYNEFQVLNCILLTRASLPTQRLY